jgi:drug/metabolite transporter (DMT)-like permease
VTVVFLALASAALFGAMTVALRIGLRSTDASVATVATMLSALAVGLVAFAACGGDLDGAWPFLLAGVLAPGASQILFTLSTREAGASRTSVVVGTAPLFAVAIALVALDEPVSGPLIAGALLIVGGGVALASERDRPGHLRPLGLLFALGATLLFAIRDNVVRALHGEAAPETAAAATLVAGTLIALAWARRLPSRGQLRSLAPAGLCFGLSYVFLFEAYARGRVSVVSPLVATESLWGVGLAALVFGKTEGVGKRLALGAVLVVAGGVLIGASLYRR